ncbi:unnamed protein product, partial [Cladocopium goreaui]
QCWLLTKIGSAFTEGTTLEPVNLVQQEGGSHNNHPADENETAVRNGALQVIAMRRDAAGNSYLVLRQCWLLTKIGSAFTEGTTLEPVNLVQQEGGSHNNHPADVNETAVRNGALQVIAMRRDVEQKLGTIKSLIGRKTNQVEQKLGTIKSLIGRKTNQDIWVSSAVALHHCLRLPQEVAHGDVSNRSGSNSFVCLTGVGGSYENVRSGSNSFVCLTGVGGSYENVRSGSNSFVCLTGVGGSYENVRMVQLSEILDGAAEWREILEGFTNPEGMSWFHKK